MIFQANLLQNDKEKPVSDQWLPPFVIVDDQDKPVGPIEVSNQMQRQSMLRTRLIDPLNSSSLRKRTTCRVGGGHCPADVGSRGDPRLGSGTS